MSSIVGEDRNESSAPAIETVRDLLPFCERCGLCDETLRRSDHPYVISSIVACSRRSTKGVWCERCRALEGAKATAASLLAGWWSLPGPLATFRAVVQNLGGGKIDAIVSAEMLRRIGFSRHDGGEFAPAAQALRAAQSLRPDVEAGRLLYSLTRSGRTGEGRASAWRMLPLATALLFVAGVAGAAYVIQHRGFGAGSPRELTARAGGNFSQPKASDEEVPAYDSFPSGSTIHGLDELKSLAARGPAVVAALRPYIESSSDPRPAVVRDYAIARLLVILGDAHRALIDGASLDATVASLDELRNDPKLKRVMDKTDVASSFASFAERMTTMNREYRGGASVDATERTIQETYSVSFSGMLRDMWGQDGAVEPVQRDTVKHYDGADAAVNAAIEELHARGALMVSVAAGVNSCLHALERS